MAGKGETTGSDERVAPPRFGRDVRRPRTLHALEVAEEGACMLDQIDRLIAGGADRPAAVA